MENIVVVFGGKSCESDISVLTALSVYRAIKGEYNVTLAYLKDGRFFIGKSLSDIRSYSPFNPKKYKEVIFKNGKMSGKNPFKRAQKIDCAFICCHGGQGENGSLSGLFEIAEIAYTCCGPLQSAVCMDKAFTKYLLQSFHLPTLPFCTYMEGEDISLPSDYPVIVKPCSLGSSIGIGIVEEEGQLNEKIQYALQFDRKLLLEKALTDYREFTCAVMTVEGKIVCSQIEEVVTPDSFYSFDEKYRLNETKRIYPARLSSCEEERIYRICKRIYRFFELKGVIRVDFLAKENKIYVNEINTIPGSLSWYLFKNLGYDMASVCRYIIADAIAGKEKEDLLFSDFKSDVLLRFPLDGKGGKGKI